MASGGGDADRPTIAECRPLAVIVNFDAARVGLALAHEDLEHRADDEMIDLRDLALDVQAQVVDDRPMTVALEIMTRTASA